MNEVWIVHRTVGCRCGGEVFGDETTALEWAETQTGPSTTVGVQRRTVHRSAASADMATREPVTQPAAAQIDGQEQLQIGDVA